MLIVSIDLSAFHGQQGMEGFDPNPSMTQDNDCGIMASERSIKAPQKKKALRCIVDFLYLSCLTNS
jgi:hypothetical protein